MQMQEIIHDLVKKMKILLRGAAPGRQLPS